MYHIAASIIAGFFSGSTVRVQSSIRQAPFRNEAKSTPVSAAGTWPTMLVSLVRPPIDSAISKIARKLFSRAWRSSSLPFIVIAAAWRAKESFFDA